MHSLIFVYGTLRRGFGNRAARRLHSRGEFLGFATVHASLHSLRAFPGITRGEGRVRGEVFRVTPQLLRYLDAYEGSGFRREQVVLHGHTARRAFAWFLRNPDAPL
jgi:gamma-glutamylcyclotransferase (GGCT)/AIG2-like uncharacterized protein YtfP